MNLGFSCKIVKIVCVSENVCAELLKCGPEWEGM